MEANLHVRLPDEYERDQIDQLLAEKFAFIVEPSISQEWTFYDTFDWRLFNHSLVLRHADQELIMESLASSEPLDGLTEVYSPEFAWDLPESQLRNRLEPIVKMRALLPLATILTMSSIYRVLNKDEKTVARLVNTEVQALSGESEPTLATYLSLLPVRGYPKPSRKLAKRLCRVGPETPMLEDLYISALERADPKPGS